MGGDFTEPYAHLGGTGPGLAQTLPTCITGPEDASAQAVGGAPLSYAEAFAPDAGHVDDFAQPTAHHDPNADKNPSDTHHASYSSSIHIPQPSSKPTQVFSGRTQPAHTYMLGEATPESEPRPTQPASRTPSYQSSASSNAETHPYFQLKKLLEDSRQDSRPQKKKVSKVVHAPAPPREDAHEQRLHTPAHQEELQLHHERVQDSPRGQQCAASVELQPHRASSTVLVPQSNAASCSVQGIPGNLTQPQQPMAAKQPSRTQPISSQASEVCAAKGEEPQVQSQKKKKKLKKNVENKKPDFAKDYEQAEGVRQQPGVIGVKNSHSSAKKSNEQSAKRAQDTVVQSGNALDSRPIRSQLSTPVAPAHSEQFSANGSASLEDGAAFSYSDSNQESLSRRDSDPHFSPAEEAAVARQPKQHRCKVTLQQRHAEHEQEQPKFVSKAQIGGDVTELSTHAQEQPTNPLSTTYQSYCEFTPKENAESEGQEPEPSTDPSEKRECGIVSPTVGESRPEKAHRVQVGSASGGAGFNKPAETQHGGQDDSAADNQSLFVDFGHGSNRKTPQDHNEADVHTGSGDGQDRSGSRGASSSSALSDPSSFTSSFSFVPQSPNSADSSKSESVTSPLERDARENFQSYVGHSFSEDANSAESADLDLRPPGPAGGSQSTSPVYPRDGPSLIHIRGANRSIPSALQAHVAPQGVAPVPGGPSPPPQGAPLPPGARSPNEATVSIYHHHPLTPSSVFQSEASPPDAGPPHTRGSHSSSPRAVPGRTSSSGSPLCWTETPEGAALNGGNVVPFGNRSPLFQRHSLSDPNLGLDSDATAASEGDSRPRAPRDRPPPAGDRRPAAPGDRPPAAADRPPAPGERFRSSLRREAPRVENPVQDGASRWVQSRATVQCTNNAAIQGPNQTEAESTGSAVLEHPGLDTDLGYQSENNQCRNGTQCTRQNNIRHAVSLYDNSTTGATDPVYGNATGAVADSCATIYDNVHDNRTVGDNTSEHRAGSPYDNASDDTFVYPDDYH